MVRFLGAVSEYQATRVPHRPALILSEVEGWAKPNCPKPRLSFDFAQDEPFVQTAGHPPVALIRAAPSCPHTQAGEPSPAGSGLAASSSFPFPCASLSASGRITGAAAPGSR
jgi:hypothetical protein